MSGGGNFPRNLYGYVSFRRKLPTPILVRMGNGNALMLLLLLLLSLLLLLLLKSQFFSARHTSNDRFSLADVTRPVQPLPIHAYARGVREMT